MRILVSRNQREGHYAGHFEGRAVRANEILDTVWEGDTVLYRVPIPSTDAAWGVVFRRETRRGP